MDLALLTTSNGCRNTAETQRVSNSFQASSGGWGKARPCLCLLAGLLLDSPSIVRAHDTLGSCVQHAVHLAVGARHMDVTLDLTFFENWSARERAAMDANANGRITRSEVESYVQELESKLAGQVKLRVGGHELALVLLYAPEVDLLDNDQVGPAHHRLKLFFFVPTPVQLRSGDEIVVEDSLWPAAKALGTLQAEGRDDCALEIGKTGDPGFAPARAGEARLFKARCLKPPKVKPDVPVVSPADPNPTASLPLSH
jgi:hypothetical protein